jgi:NAD+ dependent glucose-6-phosphate dehydrogenase
VAAADHGRPRVSFRKPHPPVVIPSDGIVVLTGAEGRIGSGFRDEYIDHFKEAYTLRLAVHDAAFRDDRFHDVREFDLADRESVFGAVAGAHTIVHLAGNASFRANLEELLEPNLIGLVNLFGAGRRAGCKRIVFASSVHAVMGWPAGHQVHPREAPRPECLYGASKVFGEALCSVFSSRYGISCIAIRIGAYVERGRLSEMIDLFPESVDIAITQRDLAQLLHRCVSAPASIEYAIVHGLSGNRYNRLDLTETERLLGFRPSDDAFESLAADAILSAARDPIHEVND